MKRHHIPASTLVEMLILMIVSGIVFLCVMEGMNLMQRFVTKSSDQIRERFSFYENYQVLRALVSDADSLTQQEATLILWREGHKPVKLSIQDSLLIACTGEHIDTLLQQAGECCLVAGTGEHTDSLLGPGKSLSAKSDQVGYAQPVNGRTDSVQITLHPPGDSLIRLRLGIRPKPRQLLDSLIAQEIPYHYDE